MARQLLLNTLVKVFGDFVDGLTEENLKVGVSRYFIRVNMLSYATRGSPSHHITPATYLHTYTQVWSGEIILENLQLNRNAIKKLNLPVEVMHGYVGSFRVSIPWARLTSESINVEIRDVVLVAKPGDPNTWDPEELRRKNLDAKRILLEKATEAAQAWQKKGAGGGNGGSSALDDSKSEGYFARLATRIADNIFVYLKNVHIR